MFQDINVTSVDSWSESNSSAHFIPSGQQPLQAEKTFFFTRIASDLENYPLTYEESKLTPLNVEIFCEGDMTWCRDIIGNNGLYTSRNNWYTSRNHNSAVDGGVANLITQHANVSNGLVPFVHGRISNILTTKIGTGNIDTRVTVIPNKPWLNYHPTEPNGRPFWVNHFRTTTPGRWSGVGKVGYTIESETNSRSSNRMDW